MYMFYTGNVKQPGGSMFSRFRERSHGQMEDLRRIRLIVDNSMVEIYINDGEYVMTSRFYFPEKNARNFNIHRPFVLKKVGGCCMSALL